MRNRYLSVVLVIFAVFMSVVGGYGCSSKGEYTVQICGYSDSIQGINAELEYTDWSKSYFQDWKASDSISLTLGGESIKGTYLQSDKRFMNNFQTNQYRDEQDHVFEVDPQGKLAFYFWGDDGIAVSEETRHSEADCIQIARDFLKELVDPNSYVETVTYKQDLSAYEVRFVKKIGQWDSADEAIITVKETGSLYAFSSTMLGRISAQATPVFDAEKVSTTVTEKLDYIFQDVKSRYDLIRYSDYDYALTVIGKNDYALVCTVVVSCADELEGIDGNQGYIWVLEFEIPKPIADTTFDRGASGCEIHSVGNVVCDGVQALLDPPLAVFKAEVEHISPRHVKPPQGRSLGDVDA